MESAKAKVSWNFTKNYQATDLAILQSLALEPDRPPLLFRQLELQ
jgi:hypothetical protein